MAISVKKTAAKNSGTAGKTAKEKCDPDMTMINERASRKGTTTAIIILALTFVFALAIFSSLAAGQQQQKQQGCRGSEVCEVRLEGGQLVYENCRSCGTDVIFCDNKPVSIPQQCRSSGFTAQCVAGTQKCPGTAKQDPSKILKFRVYQKRDLLVTAAPERRASLAGRIAEYRITVENKNPVGIDALMAAESPEPEGWKTELPSTLQLNANGRRDFTLKVTSPQGTQDGDYFVRVIIAGFQSDDSSVAFDAEKTVVYQVASRAAPGVGIEPTTLTGVPGEKLVYTVTVANNDPKDFDASTITLQAAVPQKWQATLASRSARIKPGESSQVRLEVTSDKAAKDGPQEFKVDAAANGLTTPATAQYVVTRCGDGVCGASEACAVDCPAETDFACSGRCEQQTDTGLEFSAGVGFRFTSFIICSKDATPEQCRSAFSSRGCGIGKQCLCSNSLGAAQCGLRCVDTSGAYYLAAGELGSSQVRRSRANYSFECPFVNLNEIKAMREEFNSMKQDFEQARSGIKEQLNRATRDQRQKLQPCFDGLGEIIKLLKGHVAYMDEVIKFPAVSNTTEARAKSADVRQETDSLHTQFCRQATGALQIVSLNVPQSVEKGRAAAVSVAVRNAGNTNYFGYVSCEFTPPRGAKAVANTTCTPLSFGRDFPFTPEHVVDTEGTWRVACKTIGSLKQDCSSEVHDQSETRTFSVFSRDTFVRDVSGACSASGASCTVRLNNRFACAGCRIENQECSRQSQNNETTTFSCPRAVPGRYNLTGYVIPTGECNPVAPQEKTAQVACTGCGDGVKQAQEQCELPGTDNNQQCGQTEVTVISNRRGVRDRFGFCTQQCQCVADDFAFGCIAGVGGAECSDGETRAATASGGTCTEHCGAACTFESCTVEPRQACTQDAQCPAGQRCVNNVCTPPSGALSVSVTHSPDKPSSSQDVTITAVGNGERIDVFADGSLAKTCTSSPCSHTQRFAAGQHSYFAVAYRGAEIASDPVSGTKIFEVSPSGGAGPGNGLSVTHSPASPNTDQNVTITATGSAESFSIFVDGRLIATCTASPCMFSSRFTEGTHTYFASAISGGVTETDPPSGAKSFTVTRGATQPPEEDVTITLLHEPASPAEGQAVTLRAGAEAPSGIKEIVISVDGTAMKTCAAPQCEFSGAFPAGSHRYAAAAASNAGKAARLESSFNVLRTQEGLSISVTHAAAGAGQAGQVTITATSNGQRTEIFADGSLAKTCTSSPCSHTQRFAAGQHTYFAVTYRGAESKSDPPSGTKIFEVRDDGSVTPPSRFSVTHAPASPTADQNVTITAAGSAERISVFADSQLAAECDASPCTFTSRFTEGTHTYFATATAAGATIADPAAGTKSFTVARGATQPPAEQIALGLDHEPQSPTTRDIVTLKADATATSGVREIVMFADGAAMKTCAASTCTFSGVFSAGPHRYAAEATSNAGKTARSESSFVVTAPAGPRVSVSHSPAAPTDAQEVRISARGTGVKTMIFIDGFRRAECPADCEYGQIFGSGLHSYFAVAEAADGTQASDPVEGTKSFFVAASQPQQPQPNATTNVTTNATNATNGTLTTPAENITISISHAPASPLVDQNVTFTASASRNVSKIEIFVDSIQRKTCNAAAACVHSTRLAAGLHDYFGVFTKNQTSATTPTGRVFVGTAGLASIQDIDVPESVILGSSTALDFGLSNPGAAKFGLLHCTLRTPTQLRPAATQCFALPQLESRQRIVFIASELGTWSVQQCDLNVSARSDCFNSQRNDAKSEAGAFTVIRATDIFITNIRNPDSAVIGTNTTINATIQNPLSAARFVKASCLLRPPSGQDVTVESQCAGAAGNSTRTMEMRLVPGSLGAWQLVSCSSDASLSADCSNSNRTHTLQLSRPINVVKPDRLDITSVGISSRNITVGESVAVTVGTRNPTETDRFAQARCTFRTQNQAQLDNASSCQIVRKDTQNSFAVELRPPFVGRWNATRCIVESSLSPDCSQGRQDDAAEGPGTFDVNSVQAAGTGANATGPNATTNVTVKCEILRFKAECTFSRTSNRYTVATEMSWNGGDHAHVIIGDDDGPRQTDLTFSYGKTIATPGKIQAKPEVHDENDKVLCTKPAQDVFCLAGNLTAAPSVQIFRNMPAIAPPGDVKVELSIGPAENVANFTITEHVQQDLPVKNVLIGGNQTLVFANNTTASSLQVSGLLNAMQFRTSLKRGQNITIAYTVAPQREGSYKFFYVANASGEVVQENVTTLFISTCPKLTSVLAVGPGGSCQAFTTPCDVPPGWKIEEKCPEARPPPPAEGDGTFAIIAVVIIIFILVLAYKKRDAIRARIREMRKRKSEEELPTFEEGR